MQTTTAEVFIEEVEAAKVVFTEPAAATEPPVHEEAANTGATKAHPPPATEPPVHEEAANTAQPPPAARRRLDIDGLRLVACAAVLVNHMDHDWLPGGFTGVDVFFVISGYVVTMSATAHAPSPDGWGRVALRFYARRVRRLMPLCVVVALASTLAISLVMPPVDPYNRHVGEDQVQRVIYESALSSLIGWTNNYLAIRHVEFGDGGYWGEGRTSQAWNPFTHFWSLGVEEQFYLLFPLGLALHRKLPRFATTGFALLALLSLLYSACLVQPFLSLAALAFYLMPTRMWELLIGVGLSCALTSQAPCVLRGRTSLFELTPARKLLLTLLLEVVAFGCLSVSFAMADGGARRFPVPWACPAVIGTACFILAGALPPIELFACEAPFGRRRDDAIGNTHEEAQAASSASKPPQKGRLVVRLPIANSLLSSRACVYGGGLSYALYLWHWPVFVLLKWTVGFRCLWWRLVGLIASLALAVLSHHAIERPMQRLGRTRPKAATAAPLLVTALAATYLLMLRFGPLSPPPFNASAAQEEEHSQDGLGLSFAAQCGVGEPAASVAVSAALRHVNRSSSGQAGLAEELASGLLVYNALSDDVCASRAAFRSYVRSCDRWGSIGDFYNGRGCPVAPATTTTSSRRVFTIGDSHSQSISPAVEAAFLGATTSISGPHPSWRFGPNPTTVTFDRRADLARARIHAADVQGTLTSGDVYVLALYYSRPDPPVDWCCSCALVNCTRPMLDADRLAIFFAQLRIVTDAIAAAGASALLMDDVPRLAYSGRDCAQQGAGTAALGLSGLCAPACAPAADVSSALMKPWADGLRAIAAANPRAHFFSVHDALCGGGGERCDPFIPGTTIASHLDTNHLSSEAAFSLWPRLRATLLTEGVI